VIKEKNMRKTPPHIEKRGVSFVRMSPKRSRTLRRASVLKDWSYEVEGSAMIRFSAAAEQRGVGPLGLCV